jgi:hypothetical protein
MSTGTTGVNDSEDDCIAEPELLPEEQGRKKQPRPRGKYISKKSGLCKYGGGWSRKGMAWFNQLYKLVREDRACPQVTAMAKEFMAFYSKVLWRCKRWRRRVGCQCRVEVLFVSKPRGTWMIRSGCGIPENDRKKVFKTLMINK